MIFYSSFPPHTVSFLIMRLLCLDVTYISVPDFASLSYFAYTCLMVESIYSSCQHRELPEDNPQSSTDQGKM